MDRRQEHRFATDQQVRVAVLESPFDHYSGRVADVSRNGVGLELPAPLCPGSRVMVSWSRTCVFGDVRHCSKKSDGLFFAGIRIETAR